MCLCIFCLSICSGLILVQIHITSQMHFVVIEVHLSAYYNYLQLNITSSNFQNVAVVSFWICMAQNSSKKMRCIHNETHMLDLWSWPLASAAVLGLAWWLLCLQTCHRFLALSAQYWISGAFPFLHSFYVFCVTRSSLLYELGSFLTSLGDRSRNWQQVRLCGSLL